MNKEAFEQGMRDALAKGASALGTYFSTGAVPREEMAQHPYRTGALASIPYAGGAISGAVSDVLGGVNAHKNQPFKKLQSEGYGGAMERRGLAGFKMGLPPALVLALAGGGALAAGHFGNPEQADELKHLGTAVLGAAGATPLATGLSGAVSGAYDKFVSNHTSDQSKKDALRLKSEHPFLTALPFGDMIGSSIYGKPNKSK